MLMLSTRSIKFLTIIKNWKVNAAIERLKDGIILAESMAEVKRTSFELLNRKMNESKKN